MATLSFPLGFKILDNAGAADTGKPVDERQVFATLSDRTNYTSNFLYRGLLNYTIGEPYHVSGVTSNSGFWTRYYNGATYSWQGLDADTVDDKHANGTMDSSSNATSDPTTGTNIVDHVNYIYTLYSGLSSGVFRREAIIELLTAPPGSPATGARYAVNGTGSGAWAGHDGDIATYNGATWDFEDPADGWVVSNNDDGLLYVYNSLWADFWRVTGSDAPYLSDTVSGIVSNTWYTNLLAFNTNPSNYLNQNAFSSIGVQNNETMTQLMLLLMSHHSQHMNHSLLLLYQIPLKESTLAHEMLELAMLGITYFVPLLILLNHLNLLQVYNLHLLFHLFHLLYL